MLDSEWAVILFLQEGVWITTFLRLVGLSAFGLGVLIECAAYISIIELTMGL